MVASALGQFLASLAFAFLKWYLERQLIRDDERQKITIEALEKINIALDWKASNPIHIDTNDPFSDFMHDDKSNTKSNSDDTGKTGTP